MKGNSMNTKSLEQQIEDRTVEDLELHPEEVKGKTDTYTSLTDLYGVDIFTQDFQNKIRKEELEITKYRIRIEKQLFQDIDEESTEEMNPIVEKMFKGTQEEILMQSYDVESGRINWLESTGVILSVILVMMIYLVFFRKKERKD